MLLTPGYERCPRRGPQQTGARGIRETPGCLARLLGHEAKATRSKRGSRGQSIPWVASWQRARRPAGGASLPGLAQAAVGRGAPGEVGSAGGGLRTSRSLRLERPGASSGIDRGLAGGTGAGVGREAAGSLCWPPPRTSTAASLCLEPPAAAGAESERKSRAAGAPCLEPGSPQPAAPLLLSESSSPPLFHPLAGLAGLGLGQRLSGRRPQSPQHGGRSRRLGLGLGLGSGLGSGSSGRRLPRAHVPEPRCARSGRSSWREGARASRGWGWRGEPAHPRSRGGEAAERLPRAQGSSSAAPGRLVCKAPPAPPSLCRTERA